MLISAIPGWVFSTPALQGCSNDGITENLPADKTIYVACDEGFLQIDEDDPRLFKIASNLKGYAHLEPYSHHVKDDKTIGPMSGGSFFHTSDSRFSKAVQAVTGHPFSGALSIHDRYETPAQYQALSQ